MLEIKTTSGRPLTITTGLRLPASDYLRADELAHQRGVRLADMLRDLVRRGLEAEQQQPETSRASCGQ